MHSFRCIFLIFLLAPGRVFYGGAVWASHGFAVAAGKIDIVAVVHEPVDFAAVVFEEVFYFVVVIIGGGYFGDRVLDGGAACEQQKEQQRG